MYPSCSHGVCALCVFLDFAESNCVYLLVAVVVIVAVIIVAGVRVDVADDVVVVTRPPIVRCLIVTCMYHSFVCVYDIVSIQGSGEIVRERRSLLITMWTQIARSWCQCPQAPCNEQFACTFPHFSSR